MIAPEMIVFAGWLPWAAIAVGIAIRRTVYPSSAPARFGLVNPGVRQIALAIIVGLLASNVANIVFDIGNCTGGLHSTAHCESLSQSVGDISLAFLLFGIFMGTLVAPVLVILAIVLEIVTRRRAKTTKPPM